MWSERQVIGKTSAASLTKENISTYIVYVKTRKCKRRGRQCEGDGGWGGQEVEWQRRKG
jgi:hypothetical protein